MAYGITNDENYRAIANAIRDRSGTEQTYKPSEMALAIEEIPSEGGTTNYNLLSNKPSIEGNVLMGDKTLEQLGITAESLDVTAESLGITPESIGVDSADEYDIYNLFH